MTSPVMQALISAKVDDLIIPPRSWGNAEKAAFLRLPRDLQLFYRKREEHRDREVRQCQNKAAKACKALAETEQLLAEARKALAEIQQREKSDDGIQQTVAA